MTPERWREVRAILDAAMALEAEDRAAYLDRVCQGDRSLRGEVESLLTANDAVSDEVLNPDWRGPDRSLALGSFVGPYEIVALLGVGGMGQVYRARDGRLGRDVAIKVLPPDVIADADRLARFDREARLLAALNHPNIAAIYGIEESAGIRALVLELVEGPTLADRLAAGPLAIPDALQIAQAVADALEAAHERGIVHRDLKPANIKAAVDGRVKVLDFGLAADLSIVGDPDNSASGRATVAHTREGLILGTPPYMSPEQARGYDIDKRTDIWSYGCVVYEMLTGRRAFARETTSDTIAAVLTAVPDWDLLPSSTAPDLRRLLRRCLEKDRKLRLRDIGEARVQLEEARLRARFSQSGVAAEGVIDSPPVLAANRRREMGSAAIPDESMAVLALNDKLDLEYLSDGIAEALTYRLTTIPGLRVAPWSMVLRTKASQHDFAATANALGVRTLLIVRLTTREDRYQIHAEWFDPVGMTHLWGAQYSRALDDVFRLEDEIAGDLARRMRPDLTSAVMQQVRKQHTSNGRAYKSYLHGKHLWNRRTADAIVKAIEHYRRALDEDGSFALALSGIAESYLTLGTFLFLAPSDSIPHAKSAALQALGLEPALGEARGVLAAVQAFYDWDWPLADRTFAESIELAPKSPTIRQWAGFTLCVRGRFAEGRRLLQSAIDLDPLTPMHTVQLAAAFYLERQYETAIALCTEVLELDQRFWAAALFLGQCHDAMGKVDEAVHWLRAAVDLSAGNPIALASLGHALARSDRPDAAVALMSELQHRSTMQYVPPYAFALICVGLSRVDGALGCLEEACRERSPALAFWLGGEPRFDQLRSQPRFREIAGRVGVA
jgi:serine/threonine protein kinase/tetratricopeptide (TPR) repeat protein